MRLLRCTNKRGAVATCTGEKSLFGQPYQNERSLATTTKRVTHFCDPTEERCQPASRTGLASASGLATASPARPLRACAPAHASTAHSARAQHACARLAGDAHALTQQHTLARPKLDVMLEHWPLAGRRPAGRWRIWHAHDPQMPRRRRCSRGPCVIHTLCLPFTTAVATVCSEIMMTSEMETNETMQKTEHLAS